MTISLGVEHVNQVLAERSERVDHGSCRPWCEALGAALIHRVAELEPDLRLAVQCVPHAAADRIVTAPGSEWAFFVVRGALHQAILHLRLGVALGATAPSRRPCC